MKAFKLTEPNKLTPIQIDIPVLQDDEVLVDVKAISINPVDVKTRLGKGLYGRLKEIDPLILGWDISGVVSQTKSDQFNIGDEVFGMVNFPGHGKAYATSVAAPAKHLALKPKNISHQEAAASTLAALTAYQALVKKAKVQAGQQVLIHAAAGGVGHFAVQMAKHLGAIVTGTSSMAKKDFVLGLGADAHIDYKNFDWERSEQRFDFILDTIGGENIDHSLAVAKAGGVIISIPSGLNEAVVEKAKAKAVNGFFFLVESNGEDMEIIAKYLEKGIISAHVSSQFLFDDIEKAHEQVESGRTTGKVVVNLDY